MFSKNTFCFIWQNLQAGVNCFKLPKIVFPLKSPSRSTLTLGNRMRLRGERELDKSRRRRERGGT